MPADWFALYDYPGFRDISSRQENESYFIEHVGTVFSQPGYHYEFNYDPKKWNIIRIKNLKLNAGGELNIYQVKNRT